MREEVIEHLPGILERLAEGKHLLEPCYAALVDIRAARYRPAGRLDYHFVRGKLRRDPVYFALLTAGLLP